MSNQKVFTSEDFPKMERFFRRYFVNALSGFKSLNLLGTKSLTGQTNLAVFSQVFHVGATPPLMGIVVRPHSVERHSLENILTTQSYTLNHVHESFYRQAHQTSARYPREQSEFEAVGLTESYSDNPLITAPYVAESRLQIGLELAERHDLRINDTIMLIGYVREVRIDQRALEPDGFIDLEAIGSLTCSSLDSYHRTERLSRLSYAKPDQELTEIPVGASELSSHD